MYRPAKSDGFAHLLDEFHSLLPLDGPDCADLLVIEQDAVEFVRGV